MEKLWRKNFLVVSHYETVSVDRKLTDKEKHKNT